MSLAPFKDHSDLSSLALWSIAPGPVCQVGVGYYYRYLRPRSLTLNDPGLDSLLRQFIVGYCVQASIEIFDDLRSGLIPLRNPFGQQAFDNFDTA